MKLQRKCEAQQVPGTCHWGGLTMTEPRRCYKCGRVRGCETCEGHGTIENFVDEDSRAETVHVGAPLIVICPDCEDGWQKAEAADPTRIIGTEPGALLILGTNPADLCPECRGLRPSDDEAAALDGILGGLGEIK